MAKTAIPEDLLTVSNICRLIPGRARGRICADTVRRWIKVGINGVRLRASVVGGRWMVSEKHLAAFLGHGVQTPSPSKKNQGEVYEALDKEFGIKGSGSACSNRGGGDL